MNIQGLEHLHLYLMRHGPTAAQKGTLLGWTDEPLTGWKDRQNWDLPADLDSIWSSDLQRAQETTSLYCGTRKFQTSSLLRELNFGDWDGRTWQEVEASDPENWRYWCENWQTASPPKGESLADLEKRLDQFVKLYLKAGQKVLIVAHKGVLQCLASQVSSLPKEKVFGEALDYGAILEIDQGVLKS